MGWSHARARVGMPTPAGQPYRHVTVHLWLRGRRTLGVVNGWPRWACNRNRRRAAWVFEQHVRHHHYQQEARCA